MKMLKSKDIKSDLDNQNTEFLTQISNYLRQAKDSDASIPSDQDITQVESFLSKFVRKLFSGNAKDILLDLLSMLQLHVNVSLASSLPQQMLLSLATPYHIQILLRLLLIADPKLKLRILKILDGLRQNQLPRRLFDDAVKPLLGDKKLNLVFIKHIHSDYAKFLYIEAAEIRQYRGLNKELPQIQPYHSVSRQFLRLALSVADLDQIREGFRVSVESLCRVSASEQSLLFEIADASITYITLGDKVTYTEKAYSSLTKAYDNKPKEVVAKSQDKCQLYSQTERQTIKDVWDYNVIQTPTMTSDLSLTEATIGLLTTFLVQPCQGEITELTKAQITKLLLRDKKSLQLLSKANTIALNTYLEGVAAEDPTNLEIQAKNVSSNPNFPQLSNFGLWELEKCLAAYTQIYTDQLKEQPHSLLGQDQSNQQVILAEESKDVIVIDSREENVIEASLAREVKSEKRNLIKNLFQLGKRTKILDTNVKCQIIEGKLIKWLPKWQKCKKILLWAKAWIALVDSEHMKSNALLTIKLLLQHAYENQKTYQKRMEEAEARFKNSVYRELSKRKISDKDFERMLKDADYSALDSVILSLNQFIGGLSSTELQNLSFPTRSLLYEKHKKALQPFEKDYSLDVQFEKKLIDKEELKKVFLIASKLYLRKLCERLYFELQPNEHLEESKIDIIQISALLRILNEYRARKLIWRKLAPWLTTPKGFERITMQKIWIKFAKSNPNQQVEEIIQNQLQRFKLKQKILDFWETSKIDWKKLHVKICQLVSLTLFLSQDQNLISLFGVLAADCLLLSLNKSLSEPATQGNLKQSKKYEPVRQKILVTLHSLLDRLSDVLKDKTKIVTDQIWKLESLQSFLRRLPSDIDAIKDIYEYKFAELCLKMQPHLVSSTPDLKMTRIAQSLKKFKEDLSDRLNVDRDALLQIQQLQTQNTVILKIASKAQFTSLGVKWQKIELAQVSDSCQHFKVSLRELRNGGDENKEDLMLCTYAAISNVPEINEKTKLVRFQGQQKTVQLEWPHKQRDSLYIQYPVDKNYIISLESDKPNNQQLYSKFSICDMIQDPKFNPCKIGLQNFKKNFPFIIIDKEMRDFYDMRMNLPVNDCFIQKIKTSDQLQKGEKIKQISINFQFKISGQLLELASSINLEIPNYTTNCILILTESGRLYLSFPDLTQKQPLVELGLGQVECISDTIQDKKFIVGTKSGKILFVQKNQIRCISNHKLQDGSYIVKVHEIVFSSGTQIYVARVTTSNGNEVVVSSSDPCQVLLAKEREKRLGRTINDNCPHNQLHILDYDFEMIQFTQMSATLNVVTAIDQYGEVWFLAGYEDLRTGMNLGLDRKTDQRDIIRPFCSNLMRKENKVALKVQAGVQFTSVLARDIVTNVKGVSIFRGMEKRSNQVEDMYEERNQNFIKLVKNTLQNSQSCIEIVDCAGLWAQNDGGRQKLVVICRPKFQTLQSVLHVEAFPVINSTQMEESPQFLTDKLNKKTNDLIKKLTKDKKMVHYLEQNIFSRHFLATEFKEKCLELINDDSENIILSHYVDRFFNQQQALFNGIQLMSIISEDPYKDRLLTQRQLWQEYTRAITQADCNLLNRIRIKELFRRKPTASGGYPVQVQLNRIDAQEFKSKQRHEREDECFTLFSQLMYNYLSGGFYQLDNPEKEPFQTHFSHERSYDAGGPMRDTIQYICSELMSDVLPLLRPTANNKSNMEPEAECYQLNEKTTEPHNLRKFTFLGYFFGWSLATIGSLNLDLPRAFWNRLCGGLSYVYTVEDVKSQDTLLANFLISVQKAAAELTEDEFAQIYADYTFILETNSLDGKVVELCQDGQNKALTKENTGEYVRLYLETYTNVDALQFCELYKGVEDVATRKIMPLLTPQIAKRRICSSAKIDLAAFKASTEFRFSGLAGTNEDKEKKREQCKAKFWEMVQGMTNEDRQLLLKFMCGRSRLQPGIEQTIDFECYLRRSHDDRLPVGHTCGNSMDMPDYSTVEIMTKQVLIAVRLCGEIDDDGSYVSDMENEGLETATVDMTNIKNDKGDFIGDYKYFPEIPKPKDYVREIEEIYISEKGEKVANPNLKKQVDSEDPNDEAADAMLDF